MRIRAFKDAPRSPVSSWAIYTRDRPAKSANCSCESPVLSRMALTVVDMAASSPGMFSMLALQSFPVWILYAFAYKIQTPYTANRQEGRDTMNRKGNAVSFEEQLERMHCSAGTRTQAQLAAFLDIRQSSVSDAKKRQTIPAEWLLRLLR